MKCLRSKILNLSIDHDTINKERFGIISINTVDNHTAARYSKYSDDSAITINGARNHVYVPITNSYWLLPYNMNFINIIDVFVINVSLKK